MARALLLFLIVGLHLRCSRGQGSGCDLSALPTELLVQEGSAKGTVLLKLSNQENLELVRFNSPKPPPFIGLDSGTLYLNATFDLDDQKDLCDDFVNQGLQWKVFLRCQGEFSTHTVNINVNLTDDFPPEFTTAFTAQIQEMTVVDSEVVAVRSNQVIDRDCADTPQLGSSTFAIEAGNQNEAFALPNPRAGKIVVKRMLDYENGDTHFLLNMSVSDSTLPERKSYTSLNVTVLDIDDNDPVFDHPQYVLHVLEEDTSSVGVWINTDPPISVTDPDKDVVEHDPLTIGLYNADDASTVEVNSSTGQVKLQTTFDRETTPSFTFVLKVQQNISWWRSSTVTVTVIVDDVDDHPPIFTQPTYDVTVAEHSPSGTSVALVLATDADVGENAEFTYKLKEGGDVFSLVEQRLGQEVYGLLVVRDPELLNREVTPEVNVTIGTEDKAGSETEGCQEGSCQARVVVTLQDINDNNPVFERQRYVFHANSSGSSALIATMTAEDADAGPNGDVTYTVSEFGLNTCDYVTVDEHSGDVSLTSNVARLKDCSMIITACDNPPDLSQRRCSTVPVQILTDALGDVVELEAPAPIFTLLQQDTVLLERDLGIILGVSVSIRHVGPAAHPNRSSLSISATDFTTQEKISSQKLQTLLEEKQEAILALFQRDQVATVPPGDRDEQEDGGLSPIVIALIAIVVVLLIAIFIALVCIVKIHGRYRKQRRLVKTLTTSIRPVCDDVDCPKPQNGALPINNTTVSAHRNTNNDTMRSRADDVTDTASNMDDVSSMSTHVSSVRQHDRHGEAAVVQMNDAAGVRNGTVLRNGGIRANEMAVDGRQDGVSRNPFRGTGGTAVLSADDGSARNGEDGVWAPLPRANGGGASSDREEALGNEGVAVPDSHIHSDVQPSLRAGNDRQTQPSNHHRGDSPASRSRESGDPDDFASKLNDLLTRAASTGSPVPRYCWEEGENSMPEEPEPDYAKKVRFDAHGVDTNAGTAREEVQREAAAAAEAGPEDGSDFLGHPASSESARDDLTDGSTGKWNVHEEMTAL